MLQRLAKMGFNLIGRLFRILLPGMVMALAFTAGVAFRASGLALIVTLKSINDSSNTCADEWIRQMGIHQRDSQLEGLRWLVKLGVWLYMFFGWFFIALGTAFVFNEFLRRAFGKFVNF